MENLIGLKITKTNHRHKANNLFAYYITPTPIRVSKAHTATLTFNQWRAWAWETWGPSAERDSLFFQLQSEPPLWAWHTEDGYLRLYLQTEKELNWFKLRWS